MVNVPASRSPVMGSNLDLGPPRSVVWRAANHTVILYKKKFLVFFVFYFSLTLPLLIYSISFLFPTNFFLKIFTFVFLYFAFLRLFFLFVSFYHSHFLLLSLLFCILFCFSFLPFLLLIFSHSLFLRFSSLSSLLSRVLLSSLSLHLLAVLSPKIWQ